MARADRDSIIEPTTTRAETDPGLAATVAVHALDTAPPRRALPPSLLARYEDIELVGEGGMGIVYRGHDPRLGRTVALKLIKGDDPDLWRRFIQEARAQARVQHEHVCRVYEAGQADGEPYIVMQHIDGEPLSRARSWLTLEQGVKLMREVASAVHEAHRLGLIHRDIKPQNILVARPEDGAPRPYVMDFGLAREVAERGQTMTGAVVGTPAYMPPEQALGDVRALDRRSDVYALGATLYDVLAGRPPFVSEHPWKLLMSVAYDDPPSLAQVKRGLPADLETIVMKCLERDPRRRYDSARALAEDLQRFLDGEPIHGKRASMGYVLWKKAKKHRLVTALALTAVAAALSLGGVWIKGRRDAATQARLAQALGEDVKGMELFLRNAYGLPLHDVERERDLVRRRLAHIEANMKAMGRAGEGPGHYAMGRGHLALGDPIAARAHLDLARAAGDSSPALDYALGQALGELFRRAVEETKRITNEEERKKRVAALEKDLRDPALAHLRAATSAEVESPAYVEGLIALYEGRHEEALSRAKAAFEATPWLYEAKKLEGDAHYALGSPFRHDAAFDWDKMMAHFKPAADAYRAAADVARSDPEVHRAECELWEKIGWAEAAKDRKAGAGFDAAEAACARAVAASHANIRAREQRALVMSARVSQLHEDDGEAALVAADAAVRAADEALQIGPGEVMARYAKARALYQQSRLRHAFGREASMQPVIAAYSHVLSLDAGFTWAISELGDSYIMASDIERSRGRDGRSELEEAARAFDRASSLDPTFTLPMQKKVKAYDYLVEGEIERGKSSDATMEALFVALSTMESRLGPKDWTVNFMKARAHRLRGAHELSLGHDPSASLHASLGTIEAFAGAAQGDYWLLLEVAECHVLKASHALQTGLSLGAHVEAAQRALREAEAGSEMTDRLRCLGARAELLALRDAMKRSEATPAHFEAPLSRLRPLMSRGTTDPQPYQLMAEIHARRALWSVKRAQDAREDIAIARARAGEASTKDPHLASAMAVKALCALAEALGAPSGSARENARRRAEDAFAETFRENPRLSRELGEEAKALDGVHP
ncbi:serine/threonine protein kinase [Minicystis rosea]|nr:serine/threonine protein kinase [Minicystis rosea]